MWEKKVYIHHPLFQFLRHMCFDLLFHYKLLHYRFWKYQTLPQYSLPLRECQCCTYKWTVMCFPHFLRLLLWILGKKLSKIKVTIIWVLSGKCVLTKYFGSNSCKDDHVIYQKYFQVLGFVFFFTFFLIVKYKHEIEHQYIKFDSLSLTQ